MAPAETDLEQIADTDMDSLFVLPLHIIPLENPGLQRARMIKNQRLEGVIEFFSDQNSGSGQIRVCDLPKAMGWDLDQGLPNDMLLLRVLETLPSYDVYSLRVSLRQARIPIAGQQALCLSPEKNTELAGYMRRFTGPLITQIYGGDGMDIKSFADIVALFRDPDVKVARAKLKLMAEKLHIEMTEIPSFLEDYGDIFLSLGYYRQCLDRLTPHLDSFMSGVAALRGNWQLRNDFTLMRTCDELEAGLNNMTAAITGRFETFDRASRTMWQNLSAERFREVKALIESYHTTIGGMLCALTVKMNGWARQFPRKGSGGPVRRGEYIMSEMKQGLAAMRRLDQDARRLDRVG
ncbi:hypothetical protein ACM64Y_03855 [Novispirillum sp. DQ9]|uniref:hypothetical protein n=1 Tax=Novispirillum sp. DQ9 TaxID=3398612 RepID=UPI003C7D838A